MSFFISHTNSVIKSDTHSMNEQYHFCKIIRTGCRLCCYIVPVIIIIIISIVIIIIVVVVVVVVVVLFRSDVFNVLVYLYFKNLSIMQSDPTETDF